MRIAPSLVDALNRVIVGGGGERETYLAVLEVAGHLENEIEPARASGPSHIVEAVIDVVDCACESRESSTWELDPEELRQLLIEALAK